MSSLRERATHSALAEPTSPTRAVGRRESPPRPKLAAVPASRPLTVTVALCSYNGEAFLAEQLASLAAQTRLPDEVVIGDDHSTDSTLELIDRFKATAPFPVRVLAHPINAGTAANFNDTTRRAHGDLVFLSDQDDRWVSHKIERMVAEFERRPDLLVLHTNARLVDASGEPLGSDLFDALEISRDEIDRLKNGHAFDALVRRNLATGATMAVRRQLLDIALPTPCDWLHDEWLATIAAGLGQGTIDVLDEPLIDYRQHGNNQIGAQRPTAFEKFRRMFQDRGTYFSWQYRRATTLLDKIRSLGPLISHDKIEMLSEKRVHVAFRASLPRSRLMRIGPMMSEIAAGRYARYSTGLRSIVRDFFERSV